MNRLIALAALLGALLGISVYAIKQRDQRLLAESRFDSAVQAVREAQEQLDQRVTADASIALEKRALLEPVRLAGIPVRKSHAPVGCPVDADRARLRDEAIERANAAITAASSVPRAVPSDPEDCPGFGCRYGRAVY